MTEQDARHLLERAEQAATAGDLESADELLRNAARIQEQDLGPDHPDLANTLNNLAIVAERTGNSSEAETFYRRAAAIFAAAFPPDHPMAVESRQNLESFCRARSLPIDPPTIATPAPRPINREKPAATAPDIALGKASDWLHWLAIGAVLLVAVTFVVLRPWPSRNASSAAPPEPTAAQPAESVSPKAPATSTAPIEPPAPPASATPRVGQNVATPKKPVAGGVVATAQLCRTFSTSGSNWRCDAVGDTASPGPMVFYTRVRSPRNTTVVHRWYRGATLRQSRTLAIQANATDGYRTYSRLTVDKGEWRMEIRSADGGLLHEQRVAIQ